MALACRNAQVTTSLPRCPVSPAHLHSDLWAPSRLQPRQAAPPTHVRVASLPNARGRHQAMRAVTGSTAYRPQLHPIAVGAVAARACRLPTPAFRRPLARIAAAMPGGAHVHFRDVLSGQWRLGAASFAQHDSHSLTSSMADELGPAEALPKGGCGVGRSLPAACRCCCCRCCCVHALAAAALPPDAAASPDHDASSIQAFSAAPASIPASSGAASWPTRGQSGRWPSRGCGSSSHA